MAKLPYLLFGLFLLSPARVAASERLADVLGDLKVHGYASVSTTLDRLQHVSDRPGPDAPLEARLRYYTALLDLQQRAHLPAQVDLTIATLERMDAREHCTTCRFEVQIPRLRSG